MCCSIFFFLIMYMTKVAKLLKFWKEELEKCEEESIKQKKREKKDAGNETQGTRGGSKRI